MEITITMTTYYNKEKLPFDFTPHILRYLETLVDIAENTWADETGDEVGVENYQAGEPKNPEIQLNNGAFWHFLEEIGAIKVNEEKGIKGLKPGMTINVEVVESGGIKNFYLPKTYLRILDVKKVKELISDRNARAVIRTETLELLARDIAEYKTGPKLVELLKKCDVPTKMIVYPNTKWKTLFEAFRVLSTSANHKANKILYKVIEAVIHPLFFDGDKDKAAATMKKYNEWLKYDRIMLMDGKLYIGPTEEELGLGIIEWMDADNNAVEPKGYILSPDHIAQLWVLWSHLIVLVSAYENNQALDHKELEKLYFEVIGEVEDLLRFGKLGRIQETYKRPFTSLATAHVEAKAKKADSPSDLINAFLLEITALNPDPAEVGKEMEKKSELIGRITNATRAISGTEIKLSELSYEQALFLLKLTMGHIFRSLEAISTGFVGFVDEKLNTGYVLLLDNLNGILSRKDFTKVKDELPQDLPEHLFIVEDMDTWWECGGQSRMLDFVGKIEAAWVRSGQQTFPMPGWLIQQFTAINETIAAHRKSKVAEWSRIEKNLEERKARGEFSFEQPQQEKKKRTGTEKVHEAIDNAFARAFDSMFVSHQGQQATQKIEITAMPKLQVENMGENVSGGKKRESPVKLSFPEPVRWEKVALKIKEGRQEVEIFYDNGHIITADYIRLGFFSGKRQQKPDRQWGFLCALASLAATDIKQATAENMRCMITENKTLSINNVQQAKKSFAERLRLIFQTRDDPFRDTRDFYEPKFAISPEPSLRQEKVWSQRLRENRSHEPKFFTDEDSGSQYEDSEETP